MGIHLTSDTQQNIAIHVANITYYGSTLRSQNNTCGLSFFTGLFCSASVFDSRIDDGNTASIFQRLKSPERIHWRTNGALDVSNFHCHVA